MKKKLYLFTLLLPILLLQLPCTLPQLPASKEEGKGVKSTEVSSVTVDLSVTPTTIYENSVFTLTATVKNPGTETARNAIIKAVRESGEFTLDETEKPLGDLAPPLKGKITPSSRSWDVTAGSRSGRIAAMLTYGYTTKAGADILVYDLDKTKKDQNLMNEAQASAGILSFEGSKAPVKVFLRDKGVFFYSPTRTSDEITISIENGGNGRVKDMQIKTTIKIGNRYCKNNEVINLKPAGSTDIICDFELLRPANYKTTIPLNVEVSYTYETSASRDISIIKLG